MFTIIIVGVVCLLQGHTVDSLRGCREMGPCLYMYSGEMVRSVCVNLLYVLDSSDKFSLARRL